MKLLRGGLIVVLSFMFITACSNDDNQQAERIDADNKRIENYQEEIKELKIKNGELKLENAKLEKEISELKRQLVSE